MDRHPQVRYSVADSVNLHNTTAINSNLRMLKEVSSSRHFYSNLFVYVPVFERNAISQVKRLFLFVWKTVFACGPRLSICKQRESKKIRNYYNGTGRCRLIPCSVIKE